MVLIKTRVSLHYDCQNNKVLPARVICFCALLYRTESEMLHLYFSGWNFENRAKENQTLSLPTLRERRNLPLIVFTCEEGAGKRTRASPSSGEVHFYEIDLGSTKTRSFRFLRPLSTLFPSSTPPTLPTSGRRPKTAWRSFSRQNQNPY